MTGENPWKHAVAAGHAHPGPGSQTEGRVYSGASEGKQAWNHVRPRFVREQAAQAAARSSSPLNMG